jgi:hypothetical protein
MVSVAGLNGGTVFCAFHHETRGGTHAMRLQRQCLVVNLPFSDQVFPSVLLPCPRKHLSAMVSLFS